jgi:hypothetical protein
MGANHKSMRKQLFVDAKVQGALVLRVVFYWFFCLLAIALMLLCWRIVTGPARIFYKHFDDMWFFYGPAGNRLAAAVAVGDSGRAAIDQSVCRSDVAATSGDEGCRPRRASRTPGVPQGRFLARSGRGLQHAGQSHPASALPAAGGRQTFTGEGS